MKLRSYNYSAEPDVRVEIIPLIDVIFCILTFFILAAVTLTRQAGINMDLPQASTGQPQMRETFLVSVDEVGQVYIDRDPVTQAQLYQELLVYQQTNPQGMIVLNASPYVSYQNVVQVLDLLRSVGGDRVALGVTPTNDGTLPLPNSDLFPGSRDPLNPTAPLNPSNPTLPQNPTNPFGTPPSPDPFNPVNPNQFDPNQPLLPGTDPLPNQSRPNANPFAPSQSPLIPASPPKN